MIVVVVMMIMMVTAIMTMMTVTRLVQGGAGSAGCGAAGDGGGLRLRRVRQLLPGPTDLLQDRGGHRGVRRWVLCQPWSP